MVIPSFIDVRLLHWRSIFSSRQWLWICARSCSWFLYLIKHTSVHILLVQKLGPIQSLCFLLAPQFFLGSFLQKVVAPWVMGSCKQWCIGRNRFCPRMALPFWQDHLDQHFSRTIWCKVLEGLCRRWNTAMCLRQEQPFAFA